jgi:nicotinamidase-related amidase
MQKLLIVVDMQNDFVTGSLGSLQAEKIVPKVKTKIEEYKKSGNRVIFTRDTHTDDYLHTQEGKILPVVHCIKGTEGHRIIDALDTNGCEVFDKPTFGSIGLAEMLAIKGADNQSHYGKTDNKLCDESVEELSSDGSVYDEIELCGLCTDICVVSNALILKAKFPETKITVDASCCAGVTQESHEAALLTMKMCHINVSCYT